MTSNQSKIEQWENELRIVAEEIAQFESELMSPDCNFRGIKERETELLVKQFRLLQKLMEFQSSQVGPRLN